MRKSYAILGAGRFGTSIAKELYDNGADVILIDKNQDIINKMSENVTMAICGDMSDEDLLKNAGVSDVDALVIALAELEPAILAVLSAKELGVPKVISKAKDEVSGQILKKVGCDKVIYPEAETGQRLAHVLMSDGFTDYFNISDNVIIVEMKAKKEWVGKSLKALNLRAKYGINVIAIKEGNDVKVVMDPDEPLKEETNMVIIIHKKDLKKIR